MYAILPNVGKTHPDKIQISQDQMFWMWLLINTVMTLTMSIGLLTWNSIFLKWRAFYFKKPERTNVFTCPNICTINHGKNAGCFKLTSPVRHKDRFIWTNDTAKLWCNTVGHTNAVLTNIMIQVPTTNWPQGWNLGLNQKMGYNQKVYGIFTHLFRL